jgi:hypothetical protein
VRRLVRGSVDCLCVWQLGIVALQKTCCLCVCVATRKLVGTVTLQKTCCCCGTKLYYRPRRFDVPNPCNPPAPTRQREPSDASSEEPAPTTSTLCWQALPPHWFVCTGDTGVRHGRQKGRATHKMQERERERYKGDGERRKEHTPTRAHTHTNTQRSWQTWN